MQKRLIVNADDLGLSKEVNRGILEAHNKGIVTSATLMVTMGAVEHALATISGSNLDVGLHIDLSWGQSITTAAEIPSLANANNQFIGKKQLLKGLLLGTIRSQDVEREISAQVRRFQETGLPLFHMDVHQHFHGFPLIMKALATVAKREKIPFIRFVNELTWTKPVNTFIYLMFLFSKRHLPVQSRPTDHFMGLALTDRLNPESLPPQLERLTPGLTELMCHPGYNDPILNSLSRLQSREDEVAALTSKKVKDVIAANGIVLTTFRDEYHSGKAIASTS